MKTSRLMPDAGAGSSSAAARAGAEGLPTGSARDRLPVIIEGLNLAAGLLPGTRGRCIAWVGASAYRQAGQCVKTKGLKPIGRLLFCRHHRQVYEISGELVLGFGWKIVRGKP